MLGNYTARDEEKDSASPAAPPSPSSVSTHSKAFPGTGSTGRPRSAERVGAKKQLPPLTGPTPEPREPSSGREEMGWATARERPHKMQTLTAKVWTEELERLLEDLPVHVGALSGSVRQCLRSGGTAEVSRMPKSIDVRLQVGGAVGQLSWTWK